MTNACLDLPQNAADRRLHDTVLGLVVAVIFVLPATFAVFTLF